MNVTFWGLVRLMRRWGWFLVLGPLVAGLVAYGVSSRQTPLYAASVQLLVSPPQGPDPLDYNAILAGERLAETYAQLVRTEAVLNPVVQHLALPYDSDALEDNVEAVTVANTQLLLITVSDSDPERAADVANAIGDGLAHYVAADAVERMRPARTVLSRQMSEAERRIDDLEAEEQTLASRAALDQLQQSHAQLVQAAQQMDLNAAASTSQVTIIEPAVAARGPYAPRVLLATVLGALPSFPILGGAVLLVEHLGTTPPGAAARPRLPRLKSSDRAATARSVVRTRRSVSRLVVSEV